MRLILAAALGLSFACATASPAPTAQAGSCAPATADRGTVVYSRPDSTSAPIATLSASTHVCADSEQVGFGFHHVKLDDGREGYVADRDFSG